MDDVAEHHAPPLLCILWRLASGFRHYPYAVLAGHAVDGELMGHFPDVQCGFIYRGRQGMVAGGGHNYKYHGWFWSGSPTAFPHWWRRKVNRLPNYAVVQPRWHVLRADAFINSHELLFRRPRTGLQATAPLPADRPPGVPLCLLFIP